MPRTIFFSIVTPVLDGHDFVQRYVNCLKSQTYANWEALIADDGSSDGTIDLLHRLTFDDTRFRVFCNPRSKLINGPYQARNHALSLVRGNYVCFLDIDDLWHQERLASLYRLIEIPDVQPVLLYSSYFRIDTSRHMAFKRFSAWPISPKVLIRFVNIVPMLTSCVSAEFLSSFNIFFLPSYHEDYIFWRDVISKAPSSRILVDNNFLAYYNVDSSSQSGNKFRSVRWLFLCYDFFGYNFLQKVLAFILRSFFEILSILRSFFGTSASWEYRLIPIKLIVPCTLSLDDDRTSL